MTIKTKTGALTAVPSEATFDASLKDGDFRLLCAVLAIGTTEVTSRSLKGLGKDQEEVRTGLERLQEMGYVTVTSWMPLTLVWGKLDGDISATFDSRTNGPARRLMMAFVDSGINPDIVGRFADRFVKSKANWTAARSLAERFGEEKVKKAMADFAVKQGEFKPSIRSMHALEEKWSMVTKFIETDASKKKPTGIVNG
jgi:hypothetical protein